MESMLGFKEPWMEDVVDDKSHSVKLVPWISWDEWKFVKEFLFSSSPDSVASALRRVSTWRSRGCIPVAVDLTASIIEIQQKDPFFRNDSDGSSFESEALLAMLYCMAIMRLVNGVVEKTRRKNEVSIGEAAKVFGIPRNLIDIRHESSHRDLPSLQLVRPASEEALKWLISYYWEPQEKAIPIQHDLTANLKKEIKRQLHEVAACLKAKQTAKSDTSNVKGKRVRQTELLNGCHKFLFHVAGKPSLSNAAGIKKQLTKSLKNILRLYSSSAPEVVYILLEHLLGAVGDSFNLAGHVEDSLIDGSTENKQTDFDDWKSVVLKLSSKEPDFLLSLTRAVLEKMENQDRKNCEIGDHQFLENSSKAGQIEVLSILFEWLVGNLKTLNPAGQKEPRSKKHLPAATLLGLLRRCLLLSPPINKHLMASVLALARMTGDGCLIHKLKKFPLLSFPESEVNSSDSSYETLLSEQKSIVQAEKKLELIKCRVKRKSKKSTYNDTTNNSRWVVAKSWKPCPIGMLPHTIGFSGRKPVLEFKTDGREVVKSLDNTELGKLNQHGKREAERGFEEMDDTSIKRFKEMEADYVEQDEGDAQAEGIKNHLLIDGVWQKVGKEELFNIASAIRLLV